MPIYTRPDFGGGEADPYSSGYGHADQYGVAAFMRSNPDEFQKMMDSGIGLDGIQKAIGGIAGPAQSGAYQPGNPFYKPPTTPTGGTAGTTSITGASFGNASPFDVSAQAAQIRDDMRQIRERSAGAMNEDLAARGIFSSGVGANLMEQQNRGYNLQEASMLERLRNDAGERAWRLQMSQQEAAMRAAGMGDNRFGNANEVQAMQDAYGASQSFGGSPTGGMGGGTMTQPAGTKGGQTYSPTGEPQNKNAPGYFNEWQAWYRNRQQAKAVTGAAKSVGDAASGAMTNPFW